MAFLRRQLKPKIGTDMTMEKKIVRRKLSLLELASELSNVSRACRVMGYSREQFYEIQRNFQTYGADGLTDRLPGAKGPHPNRVAAEIEVAILDHALAHPCHGCTRVEQELRLKGVQVLSSGVRGVWQRHGLLTRHERLRHLGKVEVAPHRLADDPELLEVHAAGRANSFNARGTRRTASPAESARPASSDCGISAS
jgi:hypothetical protein